MPIWSSHRYLRADAANVINTVLVTYYLIYDIAAFFPLPFPPKCLVQNRHAASDSMDMISDMLTAF